MSMAEWLIEQSGLGAIGTLDDAPKLCKDIDDIVRTREKEEGNVRTTGEKSPLPADYVRTSKIKVRTNAPTKEKLGTQATDNIDEHGIRVMTKPPIDIKSTEKVSIKHVGEKPSAPIVEKNASDKTISKALNKQLKGSGVSVTIEKLPATRCASCSTEIKKGYLCKPCLIKT